MVNKKYEKIGMIAMIVITLLLLPILVVNLTLIIKGSTNDEIPPDIFGIAPLVVTSGSMAGENNDSFEAGSLVFVKLLPQDKITELKEGDIITFRILGGYVTHRILSVNTENGSTVSFTTKGDNNNASDGIVPISNVIGKCVGSIEGLGNFALFMQSPAGILVFVGIPVILYIIYDIIKIHFYNKSFFRERDENDEVVQKDKDMKDMPDSVSKSQDIDDFENIPLQDKYEKTSGNTLTKKMEQDAVQTSATSEKQSSDDIKELNTY